MAASRQPEAKQAIRFEGVNPILRVENLKASLEYYRNVLGFKQNWGDGDFASVSRGRCGLFLCQGDQGHFGTWVWIGVEDVDIAKPQARRIY